MTDVNAPLLGRASNDVAADRFVLAMVADRLMSLVSSKSIYDKIQADIVIFKNIN
jgi:hypothetical protein